MINLDDVEDGTRELERAARLGLSGAMITEYPLEDRRLRPVRVRAVLGRAEALQMPLSLLTATRRRGKIRGAGDKTFREASGRATKAFYPALSLCDMMFCGLFERHPRLTLAIVEFELAWAPNVLTSMDYTYRERHGEGDLPVQERHAPERLLAPQRRLELPGGRRRHPPARRHRPNNMMWDNMMWGSDYPHSESTFPQSRKILAGVPQDEQAKISAGNTARVYKFDVARLTVTA